MILRVKFTKKGYLKYISHLDLMRLFERGFRRAQIPIKYSEGFNPQPRFSIANPLALGIESEEEYMDINLHERIPIDEFIERMNRELPDDIKIRGAKYIKDKRSISSMIGWSYYSISFEAENIDRKEELKKLLKDWLKGEKIIIKKLRRKKKKIIEREQNIRPFIGNAIVEDCIVNDEASNVRVVVNCMLKAGDKGNLKPTDFINAMDKYLNLGVNYDTIDIKRLSLLIEDEGEILPPM